MNGKIILQNFKSVACKGRVDKIRLALL